MNTNPYDAPKTVEEPLGPVKVRVYGLFPMTRGGYLTLQVVMAVAMIVAIILSRPLLEGLGVFWKFLHDYYLPIIAVVLALEGIETAMMLKKFDRAQREREQKNKDDSQEILLNE